MYIYLDESGDAGLELRRGASRFFVVALLLTEDPEPIRVAVRSYRTRRGLPDHWEFKFAGTREQHRLEFLRTLRRQPFQICALVIDKRRLPVPGPRTRSDLYSVFVKTALANVLDTVDRVDLVIVESFKGKSKKASFTTYLRHEFNTLSGPERKRIGPVAYRRTASDDMLQVADMIAGAIAKAHKDHDEQYREIIRPMILWEHVLPEKNDPQS